MSELPSFLRLNNIWLSGLKKKSQCRNSRRCGFHPWVKKIPWRRKWQHIQYPCLDNPMDRGAWWAIVHGVTKSWTGPSDSTHMQYFTACVYYICLSIRLWMTQVVSIFWVFWVILQWTCLYRYLFKAFFFHSDNAILHFIFQAIVHKCSNFSISSSTFSRTQKILEKPWVVSHWTIFLVPLSGSQTFPEDKKIMASLNICNSSKRE